jgi:hypothetical protein
MLSTTRRPKKALGAGFPPTFLATADEVIEKTFCSAAFAGGEAPVWVMNGALAAHQRRPLYSLSRPSRCGH